MTDPTRDPNVREMRLRYAGRCRLCGADLPAGTLAVYERARRTVRCVGCEGSTETAAASTIATDASIGPAGPSTSPVDDAGTRALSSDSRLEITSDPVGDPPAQQSSDDLRLRAPASAVIAELLKIQSSAPVRTASARFFGRTPLTAEGQSWFSGAIGELEVGRVLDRLDGSWLVMHAVPIGTAGSDIDHLVIGPGGVFTINTKHHAGAKVWVASRRLLVNGQRTDHLRNAAFEARRVSKLLARTTGARIEVTPIIAVVGARTITVRERPTDVVVLSSTQLVRWLQRRPQLVEAGDLKRLSQAALDPATWGDQSLPIADLEAFATLRVDVASARRRRQMWALLTLLSPLAVVATALFAFAR